MQEIQLPADGDPNDFWVGFALDWSSSTIQSLQNQTGNSSLAEEPSGTQFLVAGSARFCKGSFLGVGTIQHCPARTSWVAGATISSRPAMTCGASRREAHHFGEGSGWSGGRSSCRRIGIARRNRRRWESSLPLWVSGRVEKDRTLGQGWNKPKDFHPAKGLKILPRVRRVIV